MARPPRDDHPGSWHHVMNRGIARRTTFEGREDTRAFLARLALEVRRGAIEVHAYCFLTTHVHLLVRSPAGQLAEAMKRVFNAYVRRFNRVRRRDGSLFRGRYRSRPVTAEIDRVNVISYSDHNSVDAGLADRPEDYPYSSARCWAAGKAPPWLATWFVAQVLGVDSIGSPEAPAAYRRVFAARAGSPLAQLMEARLARRTREPDDLDDLVAAAPPRVYSWMLRKAAMADQTRPGLPMVGTSIALAVWRRHANRWTGTVHGRRGPGRARSGIARAALLRDLCGLRHSVIAQMCGCTPSEARTRYVLHAREVQARGPYAEAFCEAVRTALEASHGRTAGARVRN